MLFDPKWEVKSKEPSLAGFMQFLESRLPDDEYEYGYCDECAIGQYLASLGKKNYIFSFASGTYDDWEKSIAKPRPHTFGAALSRAQALLTDQ